MKHRIFAVAVVLVVLVVAWTAFAASGAAGTREGAGRAGLPGMSEEERAQMRERFQNMSEEERAKLREEMRARFEGMSEEERSAARQRFGGRTRLSREDQLKAIAAMEEQLAKLKAGIESSTPASGANLRDLPEEERTKLREQMTKARQDQEAAVTALRAEIDKLSPPRSTPEQGEALRELRAISELAGTEKAAETKKRLDALIAKQAEQVSPMGGRRGTGEPGQRRGSQNTGEGASGASTGSTNVGGANR
ncbi:MAG TPA: DUF3106 domain-containing protein [Sedimentisphaerales bacterium]|nr:DUF3106 domain-containing protein [Sedimentisphaerales bacterium]